LVKAPTQTALDTDLGRVAHASRVLVAAFRRDELSF
jgi:hypothetical protein